MSEYADYVYKKYETICKNCGASSRKGSLKCWVCGRNLSNMPGIVAAFHSQ